MNNPTDVTVLAQIGDGIPADRLDVIWDASRAVLSQSAANRIEQQWRHQLAEAELRSRSLFNGRITRLLEARLREDRIILRLGPGEFKAFLVTCMRDRAWFERHAPEAMTPALGNSALLTNGEVALLGIRSPRVSAYPGRAHLLGGILDELGGDRFPASPQGLVAHLLVELAEEARIRPADLRQDGPWPRLMSVARDEFLAQPETIWRWETHTALEEIAGRLDAGEHDGWVMVRRGVMNESLWAQMTPHARHAWRLWSQ